MAAELILLPDAEQDLSEAYDWYEKQRIGLGEDFLSQIEACFNAICRSPERYSRFFKNYRKAFARRFPYAILYEYQDEKVIVYYVFHTSQDPEKWKGAWADPRNAS